MCSVVQVLNVVVFKSQLGSFFSFHFCFSFDIGPYYVPLAVLELNM